MKDHELLTLLNDLESDCVERKESLSDLEKIRQAICAFANDLFCRCSNSSAFKRSAYSCTRASLPAEVLEQNQRTINQQLASMRMATVGEPAVPTILGILVLGKDTRHYVPGAYIQFLRIDGTELVGPIKDQKEIGGNLPALLSKLALRGFVWVNLLILALHLVAVQGF